MTGLSDEGAEPESFNEMDKNGLRSYLYVCIIYVCMFFENFLRLRALAEPKVVPYDRVLDNILLSHVFSAVVLPARVCEN